MATKVDAVAARKRQQLIILAVGGVLLLGLVAIQGPKVLHHGKKSSAKAATTSSDAGSTTTDGTSTDTTASPTSTTPSTTGANPVATPVGSGPAAKIAGVVVHGGGVPSATTGQLWSLSRFKPHDLFVQQVVDKGSSAAGGPATSSPGSPTGGATTPSAPGTGTAGAGTGTAGSVAKPTTATPVALAYATLMVNGKPQQLTLHDVFPKGQPTFVLRNVDKKFITIGVAGGKFVGGATVKLPLGQRVTLMNTATGARFVMKLVYTGSQPEHIAGFQAPTSAQPPATSTQPTQPTQPATK